jgi:hypothetical protein
MNKVIACEHVCSSDCRREGCNCACGEFHQVASALKVQHLPSDYPKDVEGDRAAADYADANTTNYGEQGYED